MKYSLIIIKLYKRQYFIHFIIIIKIAFAIAEIIIANC
jgi:hypothetical protein